MRLPFGDVNIVVPTVIVVVAVVDQTITRIIYRSPGGLLRAYYSSADTGQSHSHRKPPFFNTCFQRLHDTDQ